PCPCPCPSSGSRTGPRPCGPWTAARPCPGWSRTASTWTRPRAVSSAASCRLLLSVSVVHLGEVVFEPFRGEAFPDAGGVREGAARRTVAHLLPHVLPGGQEAFASLISRPGGPWFGGGRSRLPRRGRGRGRLGSGRSASWRRNQGRSRGSRARGLLGGGLRLLAVPSVRVNRPSQDVSDPDVPVPAVRASQSIRSARDQLRDHPDVHRCQQHGFLGSVH